MEHFQFNLLPDTRWSLSWWLLFAFSFPLGLHFRDCTLKIRQTPPQSASNYGCQSCIPAIGHRHCKQSEPHESTRPHNISWVTADYESGVVEWFTKRSEDDTECLSSDQKWRDATASGIIWDGLECRQILQNQEYQKWHMQWWRHGDITECHSVIGVQFHSRLFFWCMDFICSPCICMDTSVSSVLPQSSIASKTPGSKGNWEKMSRRVIKLAKKKPKNKSHKCAGL